MPNFPAFPESWASQGLDTRISCVVDSDADGRKEIVVAVWENSLGRLVVLENDGRGVFAEVYRTPLSEAVNKPFTAVTAADTDNDGYVELIAVEDSSTVDVHLWEVTGDDTFEARGIVASQGPSALPVDYHSVRVRCGDMDRDGRKELIFGIRPGPESIPTSSLYVHEHSGADGENTYERIYGGYLPSSWGDMEDFAVGDTDNDGRNEIIVTSKAVSGAIARFNKVEYIAPGEFTETQVSLSPHCASLFEPVIVDLDSDGQSELAFSARFQCPSADLFGSGVVVLESLGDDAYEWVYADDSIGPAGDSLSASAGRFSCMPFPTVAVSAAFALNAGGVQIYAWHPEGYDALLASPIEVDGFGDIDFIDTDSDRRPEVIVSTGQNGVHVFEQHTWCYGSGVNPVESLLILGGEPKLGTTLTLGVDDPTATHAIGSTPFVVVAFAPHANFPMGELVPGFGMLGGSSSGELLVSIASPTFVFVGPPWQGAALPSPVEVPIPDFPALARTSLFAQGVVFDSRLHGAPHWGLTDAMELPVAGE